MQRSICSAGGFELLDAAGLVQQHQAVDGVIQQCLLPGIVGPGHLQRVGDLLCHLQRGQHGLPPGVEADAGDGKLLVLVAEADTGDQAVGMFGDRLFQQQGHLVDLIGQIGNQLDPGQGIQPGGVAEHVAGADDGDAGAFFWGLGFGGADQLVDLHPGQPQFHHRGCGQGGELFGQKSAGDKDLGAVLQHLVHGLPQGALISGFDKFQWLVLLL